MTMKRKFLLVFVISCFVTFTSAFIPKTHLSHQQFPSKLHSIVVLPVALEKRTSLSNLSLSMSEAAAPDATFVATALGYVLGLGSLLLYTPIAVRVFRQKHADGLVISTWWLKLCSYTCSDIYFFTNSYPLSTYVETLIITIEATVVLGLVSFYQKRMDTQFWCLLVVYLAFSVYGLTMAPPSLIALGQVSSAALNTAALLPQFYLNYTNRTKGDYSPLTASLASVGCAIRLFTIVQLADSDPILLGSNGLALVLNNCMLLQILWYGIMVEGLTLKAVFVADLGNPKLPTSAVSKEYVDETEFLEMNAGEIEETEQLDELHIIL